MKYSILEFIKGYSSHHRSTVHALVLLVWLLSTKPQEAFWQLFSIELLSTALKVMTTASLLMPIEMLRESKRQKCSFFLLFSLSEYRITHINAIFCLFLLIYEMINFKKVWLTLKIMPYHWRHVWKMESVTQQNLV